MPRTWANSFGVWRCRVPNELLKTEPFVAGDLIRDELQARAPRGSQIARPRVRIVEYCDEYTVFEEFWED